MSFTDEFRELGFKTNIDTYCDLVLLIHCQRLEDNLDEVLERKKPDDISMRESFRRVLPPKMSKFVVPTNEVKQVLLNPVKFIENLEEEHKKSKKRVDAFEEDEESLDFLFKAILGNGSIESRQKWLNEAKEREAKLRDKNENILTRSFASRFKLRFSQFFFGSKFKGQLMGHFPGKS